MSFHYGLVQIMCFLRFLLKFTGKDEEINLLGDGTEKPEFGEWSWTSPDQVVENVRTVFFSLFDLQHLDSTTTLSLIFILFLLYRQWSSRSQCTRKSCQLSLLISSSKINRKLNSLF